MLLQAVSKRGKRKLIPQYYAKTGLKKQWAANSKPAVAATSSFSIKIGNITFSGLNSKTKL